MDKFLSKPKLMGKFLSLCNPLANYVLPVFMKIFMYCLDILDDFAVIIFQ